MPKVGVRDPANGFSQVSGVKSKNVILDTGVSYAIVPAEDFVALQTELDSYGATCVAPKDNSLVSTYKCKCKTYSALPDIQL